MLFNPFGSSSEPASRGHTSGDWVNEASSLAQVFVSARPERSDRLI